MHSLICHLGSLPEVKQHVSQILNEIIMKGRACQFSTRMSLLAPYPWLLQAATFYQLMFFPLLHSRSLDLTRRAFCTSLLTWNCLSSSFLSKFTLKHDRECLSWLKIYKMPQWKILFQGLQVGEMNGHGTKKRIIGLTTRKYWILITNITVNKIKYLVILSKKKDVGHINSKYNKC